MTTISPDAKGRASLGKFILPGETWAVEQTAPGRLVLTRLEIPVRRTRQKFTEHLDKLRRAGFQLPAPDLTPAQGPELCKMMSGCSARPSGKKPTSPSPQAL